MAMRILFDLEEKAADKRKQDRRCGAFDGPPEQTSFHVELTTEGEKNARPE